MCVYKYVCLFICVSRCLFVHVCIYVPIIETMMADCTINDGKALETNCVTPRCCLNLNFEPLIVYIYIYIYISIICIICMYIYLCDMWKQIGGFCVSFWSKCSRLVPHGPFN